MKWLLIINYNGSPIMRAVCTTVMAYENIRHMVETYAPKERDVVAMPARMLSLMMEGEVGTSFACVWQAIGGASGTVEITYETVKLEN
jgi:hypothetical protein